MDKKKSQTSVFIKEKDYYRRINFSDILFIEASGSYSTFFLKNNTQQIVAFNLSEVSGYLNNEYFIRVHRSYIVNIL